MTLPQPPQRYVPETEGHRNRAIEQADRENYKKNQNVELAGNKLILRSPDGTRWSISVDDLGVITATAL